MTTDPEPSDRLARALSGLSQTDVPQWLAPRVIERVRADGSRTGTSSFFRRWLPSLAAASALIVVFVLALPSILPPTTPGESGARETRASTPVAATPAPTTETPAPSPIPIESASLVDIERFQGQVIMAVNADPVNFGGIYLDDDGSLVILYVGENEGRAAVEGVLEPGISVRWEKVERSHAELMQILREIRDQNLNGIVAIGIGTIENQVKVRVHPSEHFNAVSQVLASAYGDAVVVKSGPPVVTLPEYPLPTGTPPPVSRTVEATSEVITGPLSPRYNSSGVWTGTELIIWGGSDRLLSDSAPTHDDGAAYDPSSGRWRVIADGPLGSRRFSSCDLDGRGNAGVGR